MKQPLLKVLLALLLSVSSLAWAKTEQVTATATGFGDRPETAVANALIEASRQKLGVSVMLDPKFRTETFEWVASEKLVTGKVTSRPEAKAPSLANIRSYKVLSTKQVNDKLWQASVEATVLINAAIGDDKSNLPSLVIAPVRTHDASYEVGETVPAHALAQSLRRELVKSFTQGGRFRVLDRQYPSEIKSEQEVSAASLSPFEHAKLGAQLGADLVMTADVEKFQLGHDDEGFYGSKLNNLQPYIRINYQLINVATSEIITAGTWVDPQSQTEMRERLRRADIEPARELDRVGEVLYPYAARNVSGDVADALYPLRVLSAKDAKAVYLTQGSGRLEVGDLLSVHGRAGDIKDPDSGVTVHLQGPSIGTLRITGVEKGYAVAELVTGKLAQLTPDVVLKLEAKPTIAEPGIIRDMTPGSSEKPIKWK